MSLCDRRFHTNTYLFCSVMSHSLFQDGTCHFRVISETHIKWPVILFERNGNTRFKSYRYLQTCLGPFRHFSPIKMDHKVWRTLDMNVSLESL